MYSATRPLYEHVVRRSVVNLDGVQLRPNCQSTDYLLDDDATAVEGVVIKPTDGQIEELSADLVVDTTGRTSHTPKWLEEHGYSPPPTDEVRIDVSYSTTLIERPSADRRGFIAVPSSSNPRGGAVAPVERDQWLMTLFGVHGTDPPADPEGFEEFAAKLPIPHFQRLLDEYSRTRDEIASYPFPSNLRRRYEDLDQFPSGLLVLGDAIASFNPIYGQGMSVAAFETVQLHYTLSTGDRADLSRRFFDRIEDTVDIAWNMAVGSDHQFPQTEGPKPRGTDFLNWYLSRLMRKAHTNGALFDAFFRVQMMEQPPTSLLRPTIMWQVLKPTVGGPSETSSGSNLSQPTARK